MKATDSPLLPFIQAAPQFIIPIYQRPYSWTEKECLQLWTDILNAGRDDSISVHFLGSIVYIEEDLSNNSKRSPQLVIDGQQRLTSVLLLLAALAEKIGSEELVDDFSEKKIRNRYLIDRDEGGDRQFKLLLSKGDRLTLNAVMKQADMPEGHSIRVKENFDLFSRLLEAPDTSLEQVCVGLSKLMIVDVALSRGSDNPQLIFESMNSTGKELSQADLIRNFVLMGLEPHLQTRLYEDYWRPMEMSFGQEAYGAHFDSFMRHYLTVKTGEIPRIGDVYDAYKSYARKCQKDGIEIEDLVKEVREYAKFYCAFALGHEDNGKLALAFKDLRELKVEVSYPLLLELYDDYRKELLSLEDFEAIVRLIEAYVFRRAVCGIPTNSLNKTFATFRKELRKDRYLESVKAHFLGMRSYRRFPLDEEFRDRIVVRDLYNFRSRSYWLRRFENYGRKERVAVDEYTIEHIMPQNENLSEAWQKELGPDWKRIQETWLHSLGNLTLTAYNSEYSDHSFEQKRDMEGGFAQSPLRVNEFLRNAQEWNEAAIKERASTLAKQAALVWAAPILSEDVLSSYREPSIPSPCYTISDHPHLLKGASSILFEALRKEILLLDPCVTEEFLKLYVAYKAETNFVDIVPQASGLLLSINIEPSEVRDPRNLARDVSQMGRWGNGSIEMKLVDVADVKYAIGLIRQALEKQLDDEE